jgi:hypothetical protein
MATTPGVGTANNNSRAPHFRNDEIGCRQDWVPASSCVPAIGSLLFWFYRHGYGFSWDGIVDVLHAPRDIQNTGCRNALQDDKDHNQVPKRWPHDSLSPHHSRSENATLAQLILPVAVGSR